MKADFIIGDDQLQELNIHTDYIRLCDALKFAGAAGTGGQAKAMIESGQVAVNGQPCTMRGKKLRSGDQFSIGTELFQILSTTEKEKGTGP